MEVVKGENHRKKQEKQNPKHLAATSGCFGVLAAPGGHTERIPQQAKAHTPHPPQAKPYKGSPKKGAAAPTGEEPTNPSCCPPKPGLQRLGQAKPTSLWLTCPPRRLSWLPAEARGGHQRGQEPAQRERAAEEPQVQLLQGQGRGKPAPTPLLSLISPPLAPAERRAPAPHLRGDEEQR